MCNLVRQLYPRKTGIFSNDQRYMSVLLFFMGRSYSNASFLLGLGRDCENNFALWISTFFSLRVFGDGYGLVECFLVLFPHSLKQTVFFSEIVKRKGKT